MFLLCFSFVKLAVPLAVGAYNPLFFVTEVLMIILFKAFHMLFLVYLFFLQNLVILEMARIVSKAKAWNSFRQAMGSAQLSTATCK